MQGTPSPVRPQRRWSPLRSAVRVAVAAATAAALLPAVAASTGPASAATAVAESYPRPAGGTYVLDGLGYGHGRGMSQWGAYGAARLGKGYATILAAYYPGTSLTTTAARTLRVRLTVDDGELVVAPDVADGLTATAGTLEQRLPATLGGAGCPVARWRAYKAADGLHLQGYACGTWRAQAVEGRAAVAGPLAFRTSAGTVRVVLGSGSSTYLRDYRGTVAASVDSAGRVLTVNTVSMESYLRSVVAWEMSPSWALEALKTQAVAARTYAAWDAAARGGVYDTCDSTACQAYRGVADYRTDGSRIAPYEWSNSDDAVAATAGKILTYAGRPAFTQFSAANGGRSVAHPDRAGYPYLAERDDPWDAAVANSGHSWRREVTAATIERAYPSIGTLRTVRIVSRSGAGTWQGRVGGMVLDGSAGDVSVSGDAFRAALGLKSSWFKPQPTVAPAEAPSAPTGLAAGATAGRVSVRWSAPGDPGSAPVTGYRVSVGSATRTVTGTSTSFADLPPGVHTVRAAATSAAGTSAAAQTRVTVGAYPTVDAPAGVTSGTTATVRLRGLVPGARAVVQARPFGGSWAPAGSVTGSADGTGSAGLAVRVLTYVRVVSGGVTSPAAPVRAYVVPSLTATSPATGKVRASLTLRPSLAGIPVQIHRVGADGSRTLLATPVTAAGTGVAAATLSVRSGSRVQLVALPLVSPQRTGRYGAVLTVAVR